MSKDKAEEKASDMCVEKLEENGCLNFHGTEFVECAYISGYTQAEQDLSSQLTACKEALREIVKMCDTFGIDDYYLFPEVQEAIKLLKDCPNDSK